MKSVDFNIHRKSFYDLKVDDGFFGEAVWVKKLRNILQSDIHKKPLGCKISDTHVKIGKIHLEEFFEAQFLFFHQNWLDYFSTWLCDKIKDCKIYQNKQYKNIILVGYENYSEQLLFQTQQKLQDEETGEKKKIKNVKYCIYEEPKFIMAGEKSKINVRYFDTLIEDELDDKGTLIVFVCGISSTLSTFLKMRKEFERQIELKWGKKLSNFVFKSIIQVLPEKNDNKNDFVIEKLSEEINKKINWNNQDKKIKLISEINGTGTEELGAEYLVDVKCKWHLARECPLCFPEKKGGEKPIIEVSDSSVVPIQMIKLEEDLVEQKEKDNCPKINFFKFYDKSYKYNPFAKYLYYGHIERDNQHYQYYVRTGHLFRDIYYNKLKKGSWNCFKIFKDFCEHIKSKIKGKEQKEQIINVIISPFNYSSELFANAINKEVFENNAHIITLDTKKEFRSNFEAKFSNYAYFYEQVKGNDNVKVNFYYVDDKINSGATFYRAKSLVNSLMGHNHEIKGNFEIFSAVIVLLNRMSNSTKKDYLECNHEDNSNMFFSLIDIAIPSIRNYADSCPVCKMMFDAKDYQKTSAIDLTSFYWVEKINHNKPISLEKAKAIKEEKKESVLERQFMRFYCENEMWRRLKQCQTEQDYYEKMFKFVVDDKNVEIKKYLEDTINNETEIKSIEKTISFIKAISRPFIYYKENAKKATLKILIQMIEYLISDELSIEGIYSYKRYLIYTLLVVLINALAFIDSTYILDCNIIEKIVKKAKTLSNGYCTNKETENVSVCQWVNPLENGLDWNAVKQKESVKIPIDSIYSIIINAYKRIICGISGKDRKEYFLKKLGQICKACEICKKCPKGDLQHLFQALYLESIVQDEVKSIDGEETQLDTKNKQGEINFADKINKFIEKVKKEEVKEVKFYYYDRSLNGRIFEIDNKDSSTIVKANLLKDIGLFSNEEWSEEVWNEAVNKGFYHNNKNLWAITLKHFKEDDDLKKFEGDESKTSQKDNYVFMVVKFNESNVLDQLKTVRGLLKYRYSLTTEIRKGLDTGAIKAQIQSASAEGVLGSDKLIGHNGHKDIDGLYEDICNRWVDGNNNNSLLYPIINVFWDFAISYLNSDRLLKEVFNSEKEQSVGINKVEEPTDDCSYIAKNFWEDVKKYCEFISAKNSDYVKRIKEQYGYSNLEVKIETNLLTEEDLKKCYYYPVFMSCQTQRNSGKAILFIGLLDLFLRNAIKHSSGIDKLSININFKTIGTNWWSCVFKNNKGADNKNNSNSITQSVLTKVLKSCQKSESYLINMKKTLKNEFVSFIKVIKEY